MQIILYNITVLVSCMILFNFIHFEIDAFATFIWFSVHACPVLSPREHAGVIVMKINFKKQILKKIIIQYDFSYNVSLLQLHITRETWKTEML